MVQIISLEQGSNISINYNYVANWQNIIKFYNNREPSKIFIYTVINLEQLQYWFQKLLPGVVHEVKTSHKPLQAILFQRLQPHCIK